jgi:hypothetical protein
MARGTRIWMSDGSDKPIERVRIGDLVAGANGEANPVIDIDVQPIGPQPFYAINGGSFFITGALALMTFDGWKLLDPAASLAGGELAADGLKIGDELAVRAMAFRTRIVQGGLPAPSTMDFVNGRLDFIRLATIEALTVDAGTMAHALRVGGSGHYFAGGFLVRN